MVKLLRLACVALAAGGLGLLLTGSAIRFLDAAHSNATLLGLAGSLCVGNFLALKHGLRWANQPISVDARVARSNGPIRLQTHP